MMRPKGCSLGGWLLLCFLTGCSKPAASPDRMLEVELLAGVGLEAGEVELVILLLQSASPEEALALVSGSQEIDLGEGVILASEAQDDRLRAKVEGQGALDGGRRVVSFTFNKDTPALMITAQAFGASALLAEGEADQEVRIQGQGRWQVSLSLEGVGEPPEGDSCDDPLALVGGAMALDTSAYGDDEQGSCGGIGPDVVLALSLPQPSRLGLSAVGAVLYIRQGDCEAGAEVGCAAGSLEAELSSGSYYIFVDGEGEGGEVSLEVSLVALVACESGEARPCPLQEGVCVGAIQPCVGGVWSACAYGGGYEEPEASCGDGLDNDCDGLTDCLDPDCDGRSCGSYGQVCREGGCLCPGGLGPEAICHDHQDDDCNGSIDCEDLACQGLPCGDHGLVCMDRACLCPGGLEEAQCNDGLDNDCDGLTDCQDPDCQGQPCGANGLICQEWECGCPDGAVETSCDDSLDNDCDGLMDCLDPDCDGRSCGSYGLVCWNGGCSCGERDEFETTCDDGEDNDCNGLIDCEDPDCAGDRCGEAGYTCLDGLCQCTGEGLIEDCEDGEDNDCDGWIDCVDPDCGPQRCSNGEICTLNQGCQGPSANCSGGYCLIPPGSFLMGSPIDEMGRLGDRERQHQVILTRAFYLKEREVTTAEWEGLLNDDPSFFWDCGDSCPVERVSWWDGLRYANLLSLEGGLDPCYSMVNCDGTVGHDLACGDVSFLGLDCEGYRLPTEAEWEFAVRAGTVTAFYDGGLSSGIERCIDEVGLKNVGWYCDNSNVNFDDCENLTAEGGPHCAGPKAVGSRNENAFGLRDMHGNVWEWVWDFHAVYGPDDMVVDPLGPTFGIEDNRVIRGGAWKSFALECRSAHRDHRSPLAHDNTQGFRPARTAPPP